MSMELNGRGGNLFLPKWWWPQTLLLAVDHGWQPEGAYTFREWLLDLGLDGTNWPLDVPVMNGKTFDRSRLNLQYWENVGFDGYLMVGAQDPLGLVTDEDAYSFSSALAKGLRSVVAQDEAVRQGRVPESPFPEFLKYSNTPGCKSDRLVFFRTSIDSLCAVTGFAAAGSFDVTN